MYALAAQLPPPGVAAKIMHDTRADRNKAGRAQGALVMLCSVPEMRCTC
jgi:hypothetical protein